MSLNPISLAPINEPLTSQTDHLYLYMNNILAKTDNEPYHYNRTTAYRVQYTWAETGKYHSHTLYPTLDAAHLGIENRLNRHNRNNPHYPLRVQITKITVATEEEEIPHQ